MTRVALQLYTVRELCAEDLPGVLETTAALGFEGVELYDLCGHSAAEVRSMLDRNGLVACGRHAQMPALENELEQLADEMRALGTDRLVVGWIEAPRSGAAADAMLDRILAVAGRAADLGLRLGFHNHDGELAQLDDGSTFLDRILASDGLFLELDLAWAWYAGEEPLGVLARASGRVPLLHVKDLCRDDGPVFVPLGEGDVDLGELATAAAAAGVEWLIVEQDETHGLGFEAVATSLDELRRLRGVAA